MKSATEKVLLMLLISKLVSSEARMFIAYYTVAVSTPYQNHLEYLP